MNVTGRVNLCQRLGGCLAALCPFGRSFVLYARGGITTALREDLYIGA